jgi:hypothetical protein
VFRRASPSRPFGARQCTRGWRPFAPILISFSLSVVSDPSLIGSGAASVAENCRGCTRAELRSEGLLAAITRRSRLNADHSPIGVGRQSAFRLIQQDEFVAKRIANARAPADRFATTGDDRACRDKRKSPRQDRRRAASDCRVFETGVFQRSRRRTPTELTHTDCARCVLTDIRGMPPPTAANFAGIGDCLKRVAGSIAPRRA